MTAQLERALQQECMIRMRSLPVVAVPVPNGVFIPARTAAERALVARIIATMKRQGMLLPGAADLCVLWAGGRGGVIELKRPASHDLLGRKSAGRPTEAQEEFEARCHRIGVPHAYAESWQTVAERLKEWGAI